ncbi:MAG: hypothetical protein LJU34_01630 [Oscillospiraceae bacterium]|nr:hypothetical protein [Oscillospiraceae bacterium]
MTKIRKVLSLILGVAMLLSVCAIGAMADDSSSLEAGTYDISDYYDLSLYVNAMGGIEFSTDLLSGATLTVDANGDAIVTLAFQVSNELVIYTVACNAYVDASSSTPGYYDANGEVQTASYTTATVDSRGNTATDPNGNTNCTFVDSMTFPVVEGTETMYLWIYLNSNVMGLQFCDGTGSGASNNPGVATPYAAALTIDWDGILSAYGSGTTGGSGEDDGDSSETSTQDATITYTYTAASASNSYEVSIPSTIALGTNTSASYTVTAAAFDLEDGAYVTVSAPTTGTLSSGTETLSFSNNLSSGKLTATGDNLSGTGSLTSEATVSGDYTGTLTFTINFYTADAD